MYFHFRYGKSKFLLILNRHDENLHIFLDSFIFVTGYFLNVYLYTGHHNFSFQFSINPKNWKNINLEDCTWTSCKLLWTLSELCNSISLIYIKSLSSHIIRVLYCRTKKDFESVNFLKLIFEVYINFNELSNELDMHSLKQSLKFLRNYVPSMRN